MTSGVRFGSLSVGITLNLRPRVSADRQWVSLEIDAIVDAEDEENTGQAFQASPTAADDRVFIAEKPGFSSRRVRTFAREIIALNGGIDSLKIRHIQLGQFIQLPNFENGEYFAIDSKTLRVFESSVRYEQIVRSSLARAYQGVTTTPQPTPAGGR